MGLQARGLQKAFGANVVLRGFDLEVLSGEIHALVGGNGAGKSTFSKIVAGLERADAGALFLNGEPFSATSRREAQEQGVVMVLQELSILPTLSIAENIFLGRLPSRAGLVDGRILRQQACEALNRVGLKQIDPEKPAASLGVGQQQLVEIAAALVQKCRVLILDEPTAALSGGETRMLFELLRELRSQGTCILYISHRLEEIGILADRVSVLRDGRLVSTLAANTQREQLIELMAGAAAKRTASHTMKAGTKPILRVNDLTVGSLVKGVSFSVSKGEIVGLGGLVGAGRTELLRAVYGADRRSGGTVLLGESEEEFRPSSPSSAVRRRVAFVPEDRKQQGIFANLAVRFNVTLTRLPSIRSVPGFIDSHAEKSGAASLLGRLGVRCSDSEQPIAQLSGGNQQKVVIGRWLGHTIDLWLLDEPTRGVDVAARRGIYDVLRQLAEDGAGILVASSDYEELAALCDRVLVMSHGRITASFTQETLNQNDFTAACFAGFHASKS